MICAVLLLGVTWLLLVDDAERDLSRFFALSVCSSIVLCY